MLSEFSWFTDIYAEAKTPNPAVLFSDGLAYERLTDDSQFGRV